MELGNARKLDDFRDYYQASDAICQGAQTQVRIAFKPSGRRFIANRAS